nr:Sua5/YciO/YrdC/YwlC family protein [Lachnospiraceae bacterium]
YNKACEILKNNGIVAVKDIGGFHLACKANSPEAVNLLREIKHRDKKAFAIMFKDVDEVSKYAFLCEEEKKLLLGIDRPIVLLKRKDDSLDSDKRYFKEACGNSPYIGAMLPSNPLQEMLLHDFSYLIMTSANSSHLPMIIDNDEMVNWMEEVWKNVVKNINEKLAVLMHDRDIYTPLDDSIVSYVSGRNIITRRSRGHVPGLLYLNELSKNLADYTKNSNGTKLEKSEKLTNESEMNSSENKVAVNKVWYNIDKQDIDQQNIKVVNKDKQGLTVASHDKQGDITNCYVNKKVIYAAGGDLKNAFALRKNDRILMSQFFGDMEEASVKDLHKSRFNSMTNMFNVSPHVYVTDMHPGYKTYSLPEELSDGKTDEIEIIRVQHHHAHIASVMAEHHLYEPVIGVAFDGTGYGDDGNVWGSEFLYCDGRNYKRYGHLPYVKLIGGDEGAKNADTMLAGFIHSIYAENEDEILELYKTVQDKFADDSKIDLKDDSNNASNHDFASRYTLISKAIDNNINTVLSSSAGRLFDAVSALLNICHYNSYEGEAAIELEAMAHKSKNPFNLELKYDKIFRNILEAVEQKVPTCDIALGFINSLGDFIIAKCDEIRQETGCVNVALSGGVFQNRTLLSYVITGLEERNFRVYTNEKVPINDGGISLGQVYLASLK